MIPISVHNISMVYSDGTQALKNVSFAVEPGEGVVILGHNGSGKSTLFRCLTGFESPSEGQIIIDNEQINFARNKKALKSVRRKVGMVFQDFNLVHNLTVFQNVLFGALGRENTFRTFMPFSSQMLRYQAMECLDRVGLSHLADRRADQLSGGQKQRVAIARMLMQEPKVVLADEPIASLDPKAGKEIMDLLWEVIQERGMTVICILHQVEIALEYGERVIGLRKGEVVINERSDRLTVKGLQSLYEDRKEHEERFIFNGEKRALEYGNAKSL